MRGGAATARGDRRKSSTPKARKGSKKSSTSSATGSIADAAAAAAASLQETEKRRSNEHEEDAKAAVAAVAAVAAAPVDGSAGQGTGEENDSGGTSGATTAPVSDDLQETDSQPTSFTSFRDVLHSIWRFIRRWKNLCGRVVNDDNVQLFVVFLIAINAIMMGIGTFDFVTDDPEVDKAFERVDTAFLVVFTIELVMQLIYHGVYLFTDGWLIFDFVIIIVSWAFSSAQIIRAFRIFRALRLITRIKTMKNLVVALFSVLPRMAAIALLLFLIFYIFAVMFTQLFKDMYKNGDTEWDYFSRMDATFFTLFQIMTLDDWAAVSRDVMDTQPWAWLPFIAFVIISGFIVVNLIIAVICDAIAALHDEEKAHLHGRQFNDDSFDEDDDDDDNDDDNKVDILHNITTEEQIIMMRRDSSLTRRKKIQSQIESLEIQIEQLTRTQERTIHTLEYLMRHIQMTNMRQGNGDHHHHHDNDDKKKSDVTL